ncbi:uncharacterized protein LOC133038464 [Cannabis sativa]|uniref:uncharacterized protein LOC133038464 n=1 Tax=Cannabis sativa TaxID=3483 RepID=UPI0029CA6F8D|nr:uncharacterized protein LOC133038464 [Cannabis sativa]
MNVLSWNCRGLGNQRAVQFLKEIVTQKKPKFIFLCETKCGKSRIDWVGRLLGFDCIFVVDPQGLSGGLAMLWKDGNEGSLLGFSHNHIDMRIVMEDGVLWRLIGLYGEPNRSRRENTWRLLKELAEDDTLPWCVIGDVNNILSQEDQRGGHPYPRRLLEGFNNCLADCGLEDMEMLGYPFTWERSRGTDFWVEIRLDRVLYNSRWAAIFLASKLVNLGTSSSDHCPIFLEPVAQPRFSTFHRFRFENAWLREPMCYQIVQSCWEEITSGGIMNKLELCASTLDQWGKEITGNFKG